ncbi:hypothetical protein ACHAPJ_007641 [Fusarium lateritium]
MSDEKMVAYPPDVDLQAARDDLPDCSMELALLHETIFTHCICSEPASPVARLSLRGNTGDGKPVAFGIVFKEHPHHESINPNSPWWQDTHISVRLTDNPDTNQKSIDQEIGRDSGLSFCDCISNKLHWGLGVVHLSIIGKRFYFEKHQELERQWELATPSVSLKSLLDEISSSAHQWTEKGKEVLSWLLAKAVWQYYSSPWMTEPWTNESLHFLSEKRKTGHEQELAGIFVNEPFLLVPTSRQPCQSRITQQKRRTLPFRNKPFHPVPKILALGIILVEIQLGRPIQSLYGESEWARYCPMGCANHNTNYQICRDIIAEPGFFEDVAIPLESLIKNCIGHDGLFVPPHARSEEDVRDALSKLVGDLGIYVSQRKPNNVKPLRMSQVSIKKEQSDIGASSKGKKPIIDTVLPVRGHPQPSLRQALPVAFSQSHHPKIESNPFMPA